VSWQSIIVKNRVSLMILWVGGYSFFGRLS
ncbi:uncharacterized protein METZ01_LOCUS424608, partial [marine metagenome]